MSCDFFTAHVVRAGTCLQAGPVIDAGGLFDYAREQGMIKTN